MEPETIVAAVAVGIAAINSVAVPWMTFRLALRQDRERWLRDRRADLYVDLLTEAYAERTYFEHWLLDLEIREQAEKQAARHLVDLRLRPFERARLGASGTAYGSRTVTRLFNALQGEALRAMMPPPKDESERLVARMRVAGAFDELETAIRRELGADVIPLKPRL
jgi:hypothetical protein